MRQFRLLVVPALALVALMTCLFFQKRETVTRLEVQATPEQTTRVHIKTDLFESDIRLSGTEVRAGGHTMSFVRGEAESMVRVDAATLEMTHTDGVVERIEELEVGLEQSFVFEHPTGGDLVIEGRLSCPLTARVDPTPGGGVYFWDERGPVLAYRKAIAVDDSGRTLPLSISYKDGRVRMVIPEAWVDEATFPVVLDPLLGPANVIDTGIDPNFGNVSWRMGLDHGTNSNIFLATYTKNTDAYVAVLDPDGVVQGTPSINNNRYHPKVAYLASNSTFLVVYDDQSNIFGRRYDSSGAALGAEFTIGTVGGIYNRSPHVIAGPDRWLVTWTNQAQPPLAPAAENTYYGQFVNEDGSLSGGPLNISGPGEAAMYGGGSHDPLNGEFVEGTYVVIGMNNLAEFAGWRVDEATSSVLGTFVINAGGFTKSPATAVRPVANGEGILVCWAVFELAGTTGDSYVRGRVVQADGSVGGLNEYASVSGFSTLFYTVTGLGYSASLDEYMLCYVLDPSTSASGNSEIKLQRINPDGTANGGTEDIWTTGGEDEHNPAVAGGLNDRFMIISRTSPLSTLRSFAWAPTAAPAQPTISISPLSMSFSAPQGGPNPSTQTLTVSNTGSAVMNWTATTPALTPWLTLSPATGSVAAGASQNVSVQVDVTGLAPGTYNQAVTFSAPNLSNPPQTLAVTLTVNAATPTLAVTPTSLSFTGPTGGANPVGQTITISNTGGGTLDWGAATFNGWLGFTPASGSLGAGASQNVTVTVDTTGLAAGTYNGSITVSDPNAGGSPDTVDVTLTVTSGPVLSVSTNTLSYTAPVGGPNPAIQNFTITNSGAGIMDWSASDNATWLTLSSTSGSFGAGFGLPVSATVDVIGLAAGTYNGAITITAVGTANAPQTINVTLTVSGGPQLAVSPTSLSFAAPVGGPNPSTQNVTVTNSGSGTLTWTASDNATWMSTSSLTSTLGAGASAPLVVTVDVTGLAAGTYTGIITVSDSNSTASETVDVTLTVSATPALGLDLTSFTFNATVGGANPVFQALTVSNTGTGTLSWTATSSDAWLSTSPSGGSLGAGSSGITDLTADITGLALGTYTATLTIDAPGAVNAPQIVQVTLNVTPPATGGGGGRSGGSGGGGCSASGGSAGALPLVILLVLFGLIRRRR